MNLGHAEMTYKHKRSINNKYTNGVLLFLQMSKLTELQTETISTIFTSKLIL